METVLGDVHDKKLSLLEINVTPAEDIYVADHSPHLRADYDGAGGPDKQIIHQVKRAYWESLKPLVAYHKEGLSYALPEVICFSPIPLRQIRLVETTDRDIVMNRIREKGGFPPRPTRPMDDPAPFRTSPQAGGLLRNGFPKNPYGSIK